MNMEQKQLSFSLEGSYITKAAREKLFVEKDMGSAIRILRSCLESDDLDSDTQLMLCLHILHGSASIVGNTSDGSYGVETRDDLDERPTNLSSIAGLITNMAKELKQLKEENDILQLKISVLAHELDDYTLKRMNDNWYEDIGKPMFSGMAVSEKPSLLSPMLESFMAQRRYEAAIKEIKNLKTHHENEAVRLCEESNLPCCYNICDIEDAKSQILEQVLKILETPLAESGY